MRYFESYNIIKKVTDCAEGVIIGKTALVINAMSTGIPSNLCIGTREENLDSLDFGLIRYKFIEGLDILNYLEPINDNIKLWIDYAKILLQGSNEDILSISMMCG